MKLKCKINGETYDLVQGSTFTENFNETLDSGFICIDQVKEIKNLKPYDDVFIWDAEENENFDGYYNDGDWVFGNEIKNITINPRNDEAYSEDLEHNIDVVTGKEYLKIDEDINGFLLSGTCVDIWFDYFLNYNEENENDFRYLPYIQLDVYWTMSNGSDRDGIFSLVTDYKFLSDFIKNEEKVEAKFKHDYSSEEFECVLDILNKSIYLSRKQNNGNNIDGIYSETTIKYKTSFNKTFEILSSTESIGLDIKSLENTNISFKYRGEYISGDIARTGGSANDDFVLYRFNHKNFSVNFAAVRNEENPNREYKFLLSIGGEGELELEEFSNSPSGTIITGTRRDFLSFVDDIKVETTIVSDSYSTPPSFYKHFLIDSFTKQRLQLNDDYTNENSLYKYDLNLFSEIKKLEKIILPNISVTQSIVQKEKRSCWFYLNEFVDLYSPKYKKSTSEINKTWSYVPKYSMSDKVNEYLEGKNGIVTNLKEIFKDVVCPEMSFTNPNLRDVISKIMITKDLIPIVFNDVIYGLDIGKTKLKNFNRNGTNFDVESMSSGNYATDARREYGGALSQEKTSHCVEFIGFRNPNDVFLNLSNMVLQTRFPIYKINSIKLCYYKKFSLEKNNVTISNKTFMCKYDITSLVFQNAVRNTLINNWESYENEEGNIIYDNLTGSIEDKLKEISKYKLCTVGYDIGSNTISGWGESYEHLTFLWFKAGKTYIENIVNLLEHISGIGTQVFASELKGGNGSYTVIYSQGVEGIIPLDGSDENVTNKLKSIVFEVDYNAMYNGAVMHNKDNIEDDDITTVDNCSSSLTILESDGVFEKEKMNRMSNPIFKIPARYDNDNGGAQYGNVQELATYDPLTDSTVYTREYSIYDNVILCNYESTKDYVLKNYYTSVWAKYRTYSFMSYGESVRRSENFRQLIYLSKDKQYYENENILDSQIEFSDLCSFLTPTTIIDNYGRKENSDKINCGYFVVNDNVFLSDLNSFACGDSLCFNVAMQDNISCGTSIESLSSDIKVTGLDAEKALDYKCTQEWKSMVSDDSDAFVQDVGVYIGHFNSADYYGDKIQLDEDFNVNFNDYSRRLLKLPYVSSVDRGTFSQLLSKNIGSTFKLNKDNKEVIDFTLQYNFLSLDKDILFSPWVAKLNDLVGAYEKYNKIGKYYTDVNEGVECWLYYCMVDDTTVKIWFKIKEETFEEIKQNKIDGGQLFLSSGVTNFLNFETEYFKPVAPLDITTLIEQYKYTKKGTSKSEFGEIYSINDDNSFATKITIDGIYKRIRTLCTFYLSLNWLTNGLFKPQITETPQIIQHFLNFKYNSTIIQDFNNYMIFEATIAKEVLFVPNQGDPNDTAYTFWGMSLPLVHDYEFLGTNGEGGIVRSNELNSANVSLQNDSNFEEKLFTNMFLIKSTNKMDKTLAYQTFKIEKSGNSDIVLLPEGMFIDTNGINNVENGKTVNEVFILDTENNAIAVNASSYNGDEKDIKSIQYYYRDENNFLHFVFGVNVERNSEGKYDNFNIYLSCVSKRNMKVYDYKHNVIGSSLNYIENDGEYVNTKYKEGQFYKEN